jgi:hypothetical protein
VAPIGVVATFDSRLQGIDFMSSLPAPKDNIK